MCVPAYFAHMLLTSHSRSTSTIWTRRATFSSTFITCRSSINSFPCSERWGDAPVHSIAAALFLPKDRLHQWDDIAYRHNREFLLS
jgi:hypothetical protein